MCFNVKKKKKKNIGTSIVTELQISYGDLFFWYNVIFTYLITQSDFTVKETQYHHSYPGGLSFLVLCQSFLLLSLTYGRPETFMANGLNDLLVFRQCSLSQSDHV